MLKTTLLMLGFNINPDKTPTSSPKTNIRNICVPFNFSKSAYIGLKYAVGFAKLIDAEITILHCFQSTVLSFGSAADVEHATKTYERKDEILKKIPEITDVCTNLLVEHAYLPEMLKELDDDKKVDMVIMGSEISREREKLLGSNASSLINHLTIPLLIVPDVIKRIKMDNILFAADFADAEDSESIETLKTLADIFKAELHIVHISDREIGPKQMAAESQLQTLFAEVDHRLYQYHSRKVHSGLADFAQNQAVDLITMIPRKHDFIEKIYKSSETKKMALDTKVPLLVFHNG